MAFIALLNCIGFHKCDLLTSNVNYLFADVFLQEVYIQDGTGLPVMSLVPIVAQ